jgi:tetratricopeptide (TPR) repeat protein
MLAARSEQSETQKLMVDATNSMNEALRADPSSFDARLAQAMLEWQSLHHYEKAFELFERLDRDDPYHAQMQHQRGLLLATLGMADQALDALRTATRLHPMSILFKTDRCRVDWFFGYEDRAVRDATRYFEEAGDNAAAKQLASGLLIDIYEQRCDYVQAAATWGWVGDKIDRQEYFRLREKTLETHPYGPFGEVLNHAIMKLRRDLLVDESMPQRLDESRTPMFPLLLTRHLAFDRLRQSDAAAPFLPDPERISTPTTSFSRTRPMG